MSEKWNKAQRQVNVLIPNMTFTLISETIPNRTIKTNEEWKWYGLAMLHTKEEKIKRENPWEKNILWIVNHVNKM